MKLEEKLVSLRKAKGLSQMKLAEKMNVSRQAISRWETGAAIPSSEKLKYLSDLYSVSLDYLLSDSADAPEQNRRISNEPDGEMVTISDSADGGKKGKQKTAKWLAILMVVVALITVIVITYLNQKETEPIEQNTVKFEELQKDEKIMTKKGVNEMKLKKFITSTVVCALAVISLSGMSVSAAEAPTNEKSFTPLAPAGWNTSTTAQQIYGDAEQEPMLSSTSRAPDGWNDSAAAKLLYGDAQEELITVYSSKCESSTNGGGGWKL